MQHFYCNPKIGSLLVIVAGRLIWLVSLSVSMLVVKMGVLVCCCLLLSLIGTGIVLRFKLIKSTSH